ncbi:uncharacterized protein LOC135818260 [Sycon ciliatum]|uniref:uncharacterized protein LOC135818260 n=1 Tax=Sycon ciliatum TaxID=27933 RepID=UPI0031F62E6C
MDAKALADHLTNFYSGKTAARRLADDEVAANVMCRVSMVQSGTVPTRLSEASGRRTAFVAGRDTACRVLPCKSPYDVLLALGLTREFITLKCEVDKNDAWLLLFQAKIVECDNSHGAALAQANQQDVPDDKPADAHLPKGVPATWSGIVELCRQFYPGAVPDVMRHLSEFRARSVADYEKAHGVNFLSIKRSPSQLMDYSRFMALAAPRSAWQTRLFLYCELRLLELFTGQGFTKNESDAVTVGNEDHWPCLRECVCENAELATQLSSGTASLIKLQVVLPDELQ